MSLSDELLTEMKELRRETAIIQQDVAVIKATMPKQPCLYQQTLEKNFMGHIEAHSDTSAKNENRLLAIARPILTGLVGAVGGAIGWIATNMLSKQ